MIRSIGFRSALVFILFLSFSEAFTGPLQPGKRAGTNLTRTQVDTANSVRRKRWFGV